MEIKANKSPRTATKDDDAEFVAEPPKSTCTYHYCDKCLYILPFRFDVRPPITENMPLGHCENCREDVHKIRDPALELFHCMECHHWMHPKLYTPAEKEDEMCGECSSCYGQFADIGARDTQHLICDDYDTASSEDEDDDEE